MLSFGSTSQGLNERILSAHLLMFGRKITTFNVVYSYMARDVASLLDLMTRELLAPLSAWPEPTARCRSLHAIPRSLAMPDPDPTEWYSCIRKLITCSLKFFSADTDWIGWTGVRIIRNAEKISDVA